MGAPPSSSHARMGRWIAIALAVIVLDQVTKLLVLQRFEPGERLTVIPGWFDLTLAFNTGAAFSFLAGADGWQRWFFVVLAVAASVFIIVLLRRHGEQKLFCTGLALVLGGALGNLIDRLLEGRVTDFLLAHHDGWFFPAFNVADSAITVGAGVLILDEILRTRRARAQAGST